MMQKSLFSLILMALSVLAQAQSLAVEYPATAASYPGTSANTSYTSTPMFTTQSTDASGSAAFPTAVTTPTAVATTAITPAPAASSDARAIIVSRRNQYPIDVQFDRAAGTNNLPTYNTGEQVQLTVRSSQTGYLYLFEVTSAGVVRKIYPPIGDTTTPNNVQAGYAYTLPPQNMDYLFTVGNATGANKVAVVVSQYQLSEDIIRLFNAESIFQQGQVRSNGYFYDVGMAQFFINGSSTASAATPAPAAASPITFNPGTVPATLNSATTTDTRTIVPVNLGRNLPSDSTAAIYVTNSNGTQTFSVTDTGGRPLFNINIYGSGALGFSQLQPQQASQQAADVSRQLSTQATPSPVVSTGSLIVRTNYVGASIYLGDYFIGATAQDGQLRINSIPAGNHKITIGATGYNTLVDTVSITAGGVQTYNANLTPAAATTTDPGRSLGTSSTAATTSSSSAAFGHINVSSSFSGIQVFVNGSPMGVTPLAAPIALLPNLYTITFKRQGQADINKNVQIYANQVESVQIP